MISLNKRDVILFSGDSITDGGRGKCMDCNHIMGHGYQYIVAAKLGLENCASMPKFVNKGYSGYKINMIYSKWEEDVIQNKPTFLSILVGINDIGSAWEAKSTAGEATEKYIKTYNELLEHTKNTLPGVKIVVCEPFYLPVFNQKNPYQNVPHPSNCEMFFKPPNAEDLDEKRNYFATEIKTMQQELNKLVKQHNCIFVPLQEAFEGCAKTAELEYLLWDGCHPTVVGHEIIAKKWLEIVENNL